MAKRLRILQETYDTIDALHNYLHGEGHRGCIGDMMLQWLEAQGATPSLPDSIPDDELSAFSVSIGSGSFISGTELTASVVGLEGGEVVSYQWTDDGSNISGATSSTYSPTIGTDSVADASDIGVVVTIDGEDYTSGTREVRYATGTAAAIADGQTWVVDDTTVSLDASASGTGLTWSYSASGLPAGVTINSGTGAISGTPTVALSGTTTVTATDQYGRTVQDTFTFTASLRAQATAANGLDLSFAEDSAISSTDLTTDFTTNGNTLTYTAVDTLPTGLSLSSAGLLTGTPTTITADANYTVRATDEYARTTDSEVAIEIVEEVAIPVLDTFTYTDNNDGTAGEVDSTYSGDVTGYSLQIESLNASNAVIETTTVALGSGVAITGLTTSSNSVGASPSGTATQLRGTLINGGDTSNSITVAATGLDFGVNNITWATNTDGTEIVGTSSADTLYFSEDVADWVVSGVSAGTPTIVSVAGNGTTSITITVSTNLPVNTDTVTLAYTDSDTNLRDQDGNLVSDFAGTSVTNNVAAVVALNPSVSEILADLEGGAETDFTYSAPTNVPSETAGRHAIVAVSYIIRQDQPAISVTVGGTSLTLVPGSLIELGTRGYAIFSGNVPTGSTVLVSTGTGNQWCWHCSATITWTDRAPVFGTPVTAAASTNSIDLDINTTDGGELIGGGTYGNASPTPTGVTIADTLSMSGDERTYALRQSVVTGETPRDVNITWSGVAVDRTFSLVEMT